MRIGQRLREAYAELREDLAANNGAPSLDWRTNVVFISGTILLTLFFYYGRGAAYRRFGIGGRLHTWLGPEYQEYFELLPYLYWGAASLVLRVIVPALLILFVFRHKLAEYGFTFRGTLKSSPIYIGLYLFMLPFLIWASTWGSFQRAYPFYDNAALGGWHFWLFEFAYALQFVGVECFFRGFLTFALFRKFGYHALLIVTIPYVMIHFNKPIAETIGALIAGVVLSYLALRSKTVVPGIILHVAIAITMDVLAIAATGEGLSISLLRQLAVGA